ncbi:DUF59 domain-containing protein [Rhodothalassium salexigens]|uniref:DUF59 domain-containing protein n=1 Tax=Rhodothalassium salexigens TaxID=1086 RepID=UPI001912A3A6|nr:DUF59 domain-containing protein [Rhodothalassium salexigens]
MTDRDYMTLNQKDAPETPERPVFTPQAGSQFMAEFMASDAASGEAGTAADGASANGSGGASGAGGAVDPAQVEANVIANLRTVFDPEIPVNIYELGLIYAVEVDGDNNVDIVMTLTSPHCPVAESLPMEVEQKAREAEGANEVSLDLVFDPPWDLSKMSDEAKLELGML